MSDERTLPWYRRGPSTDPGPPGQEPAGGRLIGRPHVPIRVYLHRPAWDVIDDLAARAGPSQEVGGLLLGRAWRDPRGSVILIEQALPAEPTAGTPGAFRFTQQHWNAWHEAWQRQGTGRLVVGWFHTHPGYGATPSGYDRVMAERYFPEWWQLTYIVDPVNWRQGMFHWQDGELASLAGFWVYESDAHQETAAAPAVLRRASPDRPAGPRRAGQPLAWLTALLTLAALAWLPGLPGSLPGLRQTLRQQALEADRLTAELEALHRHHDALQQALGAAQTATATTASVPAATPSASGPHASGPPDAAPATDPAPQADGGPAPVTKPDAPAAEAAPLVIVTPEAEPAPPQDAIPGSPVNPGAADVAGTPPAAAPTEELRYVVREGDTLWAISRHLLGDPLAYSQVADANRILNPDLILPGWELRVPTKEEEKENEEEQEDREEQEGDEERNEANETAEDANL